MDRWVALLRGINVGGRNKLAMADLRACFEAAGAANVRTYIQSGNVVFDSSARAAAAVAAKVARAIRAGHGFEPGVQVMHAEAFEDVARRNPFAEAQEKPATLHLFFLAERLSESGRARAEAKLADHRADAESFELHREALYLHAPDGIARSKLAARAEQVLGVATTARNWRTVSKLRAIASGSP